MKFFTALLILLASFSFAQDTISVNMDESAILIFPDTIATELLGSDYLQAKKIGNRLFVNPKTSLFERGSLFVELNSGHYYEFKIIWVEKAAKTTWYYTYNDAKGINALSEVEQEVHLSKSDLPKGHQEDAPKYSKEAEQVMGLRSTVSSYGHDGGRIKFYLESIYFHQGAYYFKLTVSNRSNIGYDLGRINFTIQTNRSFRKRSAAQALTLPEEKFLYVHNPIARVEAKSKESVVYVLEKFTLSNQKHLLIEMWEQGDIAERNLSFKLPASEILKAERF